MTTRRKTPAAKRKTPEKMIGPDMRISDVLALVPGATALLREYGLGCAGCQLNAVDTLRDGCKLHGFSDADLEQILADLEELLASAPKRPQTIGLSLPAAHALKQLLASEGKAGHVLCVALDENGGFCMEVEATAPKEAKTFHHPDEPTVLVAATEITLKRIGGAAIDFREGRFKLDLPEDAREAACGCEETGGCACKKRT